MDGRALGGWTDGGFGLVGWVGGLAVGWSRDKRINEQ
jgi:hypothetical protein